MIENIKSKIKNGRGLLLLITSFIHNIVFHSHIKLRGKNNIISYKGNYLRPDLKYGMQYLDVLKQHFFDLKIVECPVPQLLPQIKTASKLDS